MFLANFVRVYVGTASVLATVRVLSNLLLSVPYLISYEFAFVPSHESVIEVDVIEVA